MYIDLTAVGYALYYILPAYVANAAPTIFGGKMLIDFDRRFIDGRPIFGEHKTIQGFIVGLVAGVATAFVQDALIVGSLLTLGALLGDLGGAFIKRRLNFSPGQPFPVLDQLDFIVGALLLVSLVSVPSMETIFFITILTPFFHILTNTFAYLLRIKKVPW